MSSETWALVGVVVGALLGGVAQVVADFLRRRHEKGSRLRDERREAYAEFLAAATTSLGPIAGSRFAFAVAFDLPSPPLSPSERDAIEWKKDMLLSAGGEAQNRLSVAAARVRLVAPADTETAATKVPVRSNDLQRCFCGLANRVDEMS